MRSHKAASTAALKKASEKNRAFQKPDRYLVDNEEEGAEGARAVAASCERPHEPSSRKKGSPARKTSLRFRKKKRGAAPPVPAEKAGMPLLILMPKGREAALATKALARAGIEIEICEQADQLDNYISDKTGAVLLTEEALKGPQISRFRKSLSTQPPWSDLPLVVITSARDPHS